ncbi:hypothetical protein [Rubrivivax gelatinosus]|uniref:Uncharacterized protein n=1 Tax=Rubrivivax gelatinosus TaxID=28068 RepID=A0A4R2ME07_RUBGE|nr:hypothetical protein [Rubrivivax gelatinosus]MBK1687535.1 hypothetical protein [Rubrivivax gelatinosus]MCD0423631.1 hypothetical protein [Rubrivivax sp. JA1024]TCP02907.1 hypothetical protein EV684_10573 [Rubrivivax gelatinosus]
MRIDIDTLDEAQLLDLNRRIVARLKLLHDMKAHVQMMDFRVGEKVSFQPDGHPVLFGIITKYNRKTVTVITETGMQWNVAPAFLRKLKTVDEAPAAGAVARHHPG